MLYGNWIFLRGLNFRLIPVELLTLLDQYADDEYNFQLMKMDLTENKPVVTIAVNVTSYDGEPFTQLWEVTVDRYVKGGAR